MSKDHDDGDFSTKSLKGSKKLYWRENGENNLVEWKINVVQAAKGIFGSFAQCLEDEVIPKEWEDEFEEPDGASIRGLNTLALKRLELQMTNYISRQEKWKEVKPKMVTFLMECCTESSIFRVESQSKTDWVAAKKNNDPVVALLLLSRSHTFFGKTASSREQQKVVGEVYNFVWKSPET
eukprot:gene42211-52430_t